MKEPKMTPSSSAETLVISNKTHVITSEVDAAMDPLTRNLKAAKNDDAPIPEYLWDQAIVPDGNPLKLGALSGLRTFALRWWCRHTTKEFLKWMRNKHSPSLHSSEYVRDLNAGRDCITRCCNASWWEWSGGSRPLFWRWPCDYRTKIRDGLPLWTKVNMPKYFVPQRIEKDEAARKVVTSKLSGVREKGYVTSGEIRSLISYFTVPKGDGDVRMVYDATKSGLNAQLWAPWFLLPTVESHLRCVQPGTFMGDIDLSEQFLNFVLHERVQPFAGIDATPYFPEELSDQKKVIWLRWTRCGMGFVSSPYTAVQGTLIAEEVIRGDPSCPNNIFHWDDVILNLPGDQNYVPHNPWVYKMRVDGAHSTPSIANDLKIYVDVVIILVFCYDECRLG